MQDQEKLREAIKNAKVAEITDKNGNKIPVTGAQAISTGVYTSIPASEPRPIYKTDSGWSYRASDASTSISLDENTGNIKVVAPKAITDLPEFKKTFDEEVLKTYSKAYKLNPDYKVKIQELNEETGEQEEKDVTIPEWVQKANSSLKNFMDNIRSADDYRDALVKEYGDKAKNLSYTQIAMSGQSDKNTYIPNILKNVNFFGDDPSKGNPFKKILDKLGKDGEISAEDLKEIWNKDNFGRTELAGVLATIDGALKGSDWNSESYYKDEDGNDVYNNSSANEAAKLLAFRNYLISHHPEGQWWQEVGTNIETASIGVMYGTTRYFSNLANIGEAIFTGGEGTSAQNFIKDMDETMAFYQETQSLESDATQIMFNLGMIGGTVLATFGTNAVIKGAAQDLGKLNNFVASKMINTPTNLANAAAVANMGPSAMFALTEETMAQIMSNSNIYTLGARIAMKFASVAEKVSIAKGVYDAFMEGHAGLHWASSFLVDTFHDALVYDSVTLREVLANSDDENMRNYWLGQLADNAKWWGTMAFAKGALKFAGKTAVGSALNIRLTKFNNRVAAKFGNWKTSLKDNVYGGDVVKKLEAQLDEANNKGNRKTANRLRRKIEQEKWNAELRSAREQLGHLDLDWNGLKLTEESLEKYKNATTRVKALEIGIDRYNRSLEYQRQTMVGWQYDPSTGKYGFINPLLGTANNNASEWYLKLSELESKYGYSPAKGLISQDSIDYWVGRYKENLYEAFSKGATENAGKATEALATIRANNAVVGSRLAQEIKDYIDEGIANKTYQKWYFEQNEYGIAKGILNRGKMESYMAGEAWKENGYMPIVVTDLDPKAKFVDTDGSFQAKIEQETQKLKFAADPGEHYADPELIRQSRLDELARIEVNNDLWKAYSGFGSNATNKTVVTAEETEYARRVESAKKALEEEVGRQAKLSFHENFGVTPEGTRRRPPISYKTVPVMYRGDVVASLPEDYVSEYLVKHNIIASPTAKFTDMVTEENYVEWFKSQNPTVKKFLKQKYAEYSDFDSDISVVDVDRYVSTYKARDFKVTDQHYKSNKTLQEMLSDKELKRNGISDPEDFKKFLSGYVDEFVTPARKGTIWEDQPNDKITFEDLDQAVYTYRNSKMSDLFYSDENTDFLKTIGWDRDYIPNTDTGKVAAAHSYISEAEERDMLEALEISTDNVLSLPELKRTELHEMSHAAWARASAETRQRVGQNLVNRLGFNVPVDKELACSIAMNELVAYSTEARFAGKTVTDILNNSDAQKYLDEVARYAGVKNNKTFRQRVAGVLESFLTYVKTKLLGINDAKNFDDWYEGLLDGSFADDLRRDLGEFRGQKGFATNYDLSGTVSRFADPKFTGTFEDLQTAIKEGGMDFEDGLRRSYLMGDKEFTRSRLMNEGAHNLKMGRDAFYQGVVVADIKAALRNVKKVNTSKFVDDMFESLKGQVDGYVAGVLRNKGAQEAIAVLAETENASEEFGRYIALRRLKESNMDSLYKALDDNVERELKKIKDIPYEDVELLKTYTHKMADEVVETEIDEAAKSARTINADIIDSKTIYDKAKALNDKITGVEKQVGVEGSNVVMYLDDNGRQVFAEADPAFASLFTTRYRMEKTEASALAKINAFTSRMFRYGTTSVNLSSFGNQLFRDFGNALLVGGSWHTIKTYRKNLVDIYGKNIVDQIGRFDPDGYEMKQLKKLAEDNNQTLEEAAVSRELMRGAAISPTTTETTLYRDFMNDAYKGDIDSETRLNNMRNTFSNFVKKYDPDQFLNGKRENYLRNRVYASSYNDAMKAGYTVEQARIFSEFAMNNATTNFSRQLYHLQAIADSTPYFRAAINGTKSFWRMWSLDPVGITGRITGGLILPVMFLTGASLGSEEDRKIYQNIPEYQKADSLIFVVKGQIISAPMPQEIAPIVAPFRQFVEYLYDSNKNDFWELMMNDTLGFFPYELSGFSTIDMDQMISDPTIFDRMSRGVARVFSQMAPVPAKSVYMLVTGTDPYTGKNLRNPAYSYWNDETGSVETLDYNQNSFAKWFASLPFVKDWMTPDLAEKVVSGVVGTTGSHLLGDITALATKGGDAALQETMSNIGAQVMKPFTVEKYNLTDAIWNRAVKQMTAKKKDILASDEMQTLNSKLSQEKDPEKRKKLLAERQNLVDEYQQKVGDMVKNLESKYNGTFDDKKFAAVIQLLNFNTNAPYQAASQYASDLASNLYWEGRDGAIQTMKDLGINGVHDSSIFGYLTQDKDGNVVMRYSTPTAIMDMGNAWSNQADYHLANIKALASENDLWDRHSAMQDQINAIYNKNKLSDSDYDQIDSIYVNWNAEVMAALAPYIEAMTPEAAINNSKVMDYLEDLIEVPGDYKKDKYGRYVTNSKLGNGSASAAYIQNYIKNIFKINDTSYSSGHNYSDRKTYDKENKRWK